MPRKLIVEAINRTLASDATPDPKRLIEHLAKLFDVSEQAMEFKLLNLGLAVSV
jgi:Zn-dependent peptidase ImmA (M78 family)